MSRFGVESPIRWRALVLSAGFGTRLRPLTWTQPKPLLPLCGRPLVSRTLESLALAGCETAVLNLHHLPDAIPESLGDEAFGMPLRYSREDPILGTLGALGPPRDVLVGSGVDIDVDEDVDAVVLVNGDSLCRWPVESVLRRHLRSGADVTLLLLARAPDAALGGGIAVDQAGRVVQMREHPARPAVGRVRRHVFAGLHVLRPELLQRVPDGPGDVIDGLYQPLLDEGGDIRAFVTRRLWHDVGTPRRYLEAALEQAVRPWHGLGKNSCVAPDARVADDARLRRAVLESGVVVEAGARVERSLLLPGSRVGRDAVLKGAVLGPGVQLSAGSNVEHRLLTRRSPKHVLKPGESILGDVVYTPLTRVGA